jgi:hypothetical protein
VSCWEFTDEETWAGKPIARKLRDLEARRRFVVTGWLRDAGTTLVGKAETFSCVLDDGTGSVGLLFLGRQTVPGLVDSTRCTAEGTAQAVREELVAWDPLYRIEPEDWDDR